MIKPRVAISEKDVQAQRKVATTLNQTRVRVSSFRGTMTKFGRRLSLLLLHATRKAVESF